MVALRYDGKVGVFGVFWGVRFRYIRYLVMIPEAILSCTYCYP